MPLPNKHILGADSIDSGAGRCSIMSKFSQTVVDIYGWKCKGSHGLLILPSLVENVCCDYRREKDKAEIDVRYMNKILLIMFYTYMI